MHVLEILHLSCYINCDLMTLWVSRGSFLAKFEPLWSSLESSSRQRMDESWCFRDAQLTDYVSLQSARLMQDCSPNLL